MRNEVGNEAGNEAGNEVGNEVGNEAGNEARNEAVIQTHNRFQTTSLLHFSSTTERNSVSCVAATSFSSASKKTNQHQYTIKPPMQ